MKVDAIYGERADRHQRIMDLSADDLHSEFPWTATLEFNETMAKAEFDEKIVPAESCIMGARRLPTSPAVLPLTLPLAIDPSQGAIPLASPIGSSSAMSKAKSCLRCGLIVCAAGPYLSPDLSHMD